MGAVWRRDVKWLIRLVTIVNIIAFCLFDYSPRIHGSAPNINRISVSIEVVCNIFFGIETLCEVIAQGFMLEKGTYMRSGWNIINLSTFLCTWSILADPDSSSVLILLCRNVRLLRCMRFIQDISLLKTQMDAFVESFPRLQTILIPLIFVMIFYSIIGIHLFSGLTEKRCRLTPEPVAGEWEVDTNIKNLCGIWDCPDQ